MGGNITLLRRDKDIALPAKTGGRPWMPDIQKGSIVTLFHHTLKLHGCTYRPMKPQTIDGLQETLVDLEKQLEKAEEKYHTLRARVDAVRDALEVLGKPT